MITIAPHTSNVSIQHSDINGHHNGNIDINNTLLLVVALL